jgi:hypothetical protein
MLTVSSACVVEGIDEAPGADPTLVEAIADAMLSLSTEKGHVTLADLLIRACEGAARLSPVYVQLVWACGQQLEAKFMSEARAHDGGHPRAGQELATLPLVPAWPNVATALQPQTSIKQVGDVAFAPGFASFGIACRTRVMHSEGKRCLCWLLEGAILNLSVVFARKRFAPHIGFIPRASSRPLWVQAL